MKTQKIKDELIAEAIQHREQDMLIKGEYWDGHKGCSVGCFVKTNDDPHEKLAERSGMPEFMHHLQDTIFEGLPGATRLKWSERFFKAAPVGLSHEQYDIQIKAPFLVFVLQSTLGTFDHEKFPDVKAAVDGSIALWQRDDIALVRKVAPVAGVSDGY